jgi:hypothetical protein
MGAYCILIHLIVRIAVWVVQNSFVIIKTKSPTIRILMFEKVIVIYLRQPFLKFCTFFHRLIDEVRSSIKIFFETIKYTIIRKLLLLL